MSKALFSSSFSPQKPCRVLLLGLVLATWVFGCRSRSRSSSCSGSCSGSKKAVSAGKSHAVDRSEMVSDQIEARGIRDQRVLAAMQKVKRHLFVPGRLRAMAYADQPLPIGKGQTISQPYIVAFMTEAAHLSAKDKVLEVGTGSGYQAAVLAEVAAHVYTIEIIRPLALKARKLLLSLGYKNISFRVGDGYQGWSEAAPFDAILITAAPPRIPKPLLDQLKTGGRMILPVGEESQELVRITRTPNGYRREHLLWVRFVPMTGKAQHD